MDIFIPKELEPGETRTAAVPATVQRLARLGAKVTVEAGVGSSIFAVDDAYEQAGARISGNRAKSLGDADMVLTLRRLPSEDISFFKAGALLVGFLDPFDGRDWIKTVASKRITAVSMELMPRSTVAQKMDAISSQANLAGYMSVILGAEKLDRIMPMMMTPAGTIQPARVFVIGAGVAGLQAIATAKRLGARVDAFDTRPVVREQVESLGAKFFEVNLGETGQTQEGYAKALSEEQLQKQREAMKKQCAVSDIVITTAQVFGKKAPLILTKDMVHSMRPGSVVVDLAVESGGNVEGSRLGEEVDLGGVRLIGFANLPGRVAWNASEMYANNLAHFVAHFWNQEERKFDFNPEEEIPKGCIVTHGGAVVHPLVKQAFDL